MHQLVCSFIGQHEPRFLFFLRMGGGKTKIILDLIRYYQQLGQLQSALIGVPNKINVGTWKRQIRVHRPELSVIELAGTRAQRLEQVNEHADVYIINYQGLPVFMSDLQRAKKGRMEHRINPAQTKMFTSIFNLCCWDEMHLLGRYGTITYDCADRVSAACDFAYGTTGTPFGRDPQKLWSEFHVIDRGETLGPTLGLFRGVFYNAVKDFWAGTKYNFKKGMALDLNRMIQHRSIRYNDKELGKKSKPQRQSIIVPLSAEQARFYADIRKRLRDAHIAGDTKAMGNVFIRSRQCTGGFISMRDQDDLKLEVQFEHVSKIEALSELLTQFDPSEKVVIFHEFIYSGVLIQQRLKKMKLQVAGVGRGFADPEAQVNRFLTDRNCRIFLANWKAGGTGVDGLHEVCRYEIFYESPTGPDTRDQCETRVDRGRTQKRQVVIYDILCRDTVDTRIHHSLREGIDMHEAVMEGKVKNI